MNELRLPKPKRAAKVSKPLKRTGKRGNHTSRHRAKRMSLAKQANTMWALWIKRHGRCEFIGERVGHKIHTVCGGGLQAMHGFGKKAYPAARYSAFNGFCGCAAVHSYFSWRPPEWENFLRSRWGEEQYQHRLQMAMLTTKHDLRMVIETYRAALSGVEMHE